MSRQIANSIGRMTFVPSFHACKQAGSVAVAAGRHSTFTMKTGMYSPSLGNVQTQVRFFSSLSPRIRRAYPQYNVHGEAHLLTVKMIPPIYKLIKGEALAMHPNNRGKLVLEFTPRTFGEKTYDWNLQTKFILNVEEVGLLYSQLPQNSVELSRTAIQSNEEDGGNTLVTVDSPNKVLKISPLADDPSALEFSLDFYLHGIGNQDQVSLIHGWTIEFTIIA